jgi:hypothetical protein
LNGSGWVPTVRGRVLRSKSSPVIVGLLLAGCQAVESGSSGAPQPTHVGGTSATDVGLGGAPAATGGSDVGNGDTGGTASDVSSALGGDGSIAGSSGATGGTSGDPGGAATAGSTAAGSNATGGAGGTARASVLQHHNHASRDGVYVDAAITRASAAGLHLDASFASATLAGPTYTQPLYLAGVAGSPDLVIVATEQNRIFAFDAANGALVYDTPLAAPVPRTTFNSLLSPISSLDHRCCNIDPLGVTGTPIIDPMTRTLYVDAMTGLGTGGTATRHLVYAVNADTGQPLAAPEWPVDLDAKVPAGSTTFNSFVQNQRGALALLGDRLYVPFGGHWGDCGDYHGWIVEISTSDPSQVNGWTTRANAGGVWAPGGIAADDTSIYFVTGNTEESPNLFSSPDTWMDGEAVFRMRPGLATDSADYFVPTNWALLDTNDSDLGGSNPVLVDVPGATPEK